MWPLLLLTRPEAEAEVERVFLHFDARHYAKLSRGSMMLIFGPQNDLAGITVREKTTVWLGGLEIMFNCLAATGTATGLTKS